MMLKCIDILNAPVNLFWFPSKLYPCFNTVTQDHIFHRQSNYFFFLNAFRNVRSKLISQLLSVIRSISPFNWNR